jgi:hypothetical protein
MSRVSTHGTPKRGNGITEIMENSVRQAIPRQRGHDINGFVPDLKSEIPPKETADPESAAFMAVDLRKEPETILSSILPFAPWGGHGTEFHHISVTALPGPELATFLMRKSMFLGAPVRGTTAGEVNFAIISSLIRRQIPAHACHAWAGQEPPGVVLPRMCMG